MSFKVVMMLDKVEHSLILDAKNENDARKKARDWVANTYPWTMKIKFIAVIEV